MKKLTQLWQAFERIPGLTTTTPYWKHYCGPDYEMIRPFLHATEFNGGTYPCGKAESEGCFREIVDYGQGEVSAVCRQEWDCCAEVHLTSDDTVLYEVDLPSFTSAIARSLGFRWQNSQDGQHGPWVIGFLSDGPGSDRTVFLITKPSLAEFLDSVLKVVVHPENRKVILAPTNQFKGAEVQKLLDQYRIPLYPLEELILGQEDGTLGSPNALADLVSGRGVSKATATVSVTQASGRRGRGFAADSEGHRRAAAAVSAFGDGWTKQLPQLCRELQRAGVDIPKYWRETECLETWDEIAKEIEGLGKSSGRERVSKHIKHRLDWVRRHPSDSL